MNKEAIKQIKTVFESINDHNKSQDIIGLLQDINRLSTLRCNLRDDWADSKMKADEMEADYKNKVDSRMLDLRAEGKTIEESKAQARMECSPDYSAYLKAEKEKNQLTALRDDLASKISVVQSYASGLKAEKGFKEL